MARIAFFAPLKPPTHPNPSGDREMARNLMRILAARGDRVDLMSELRLLDRKGNPEQQDLLNTAAEAETRKILDEVGNDPPVLWVTYHNYYKAPDLIGPVVSKALSIPYVQLESTRATKRLTGPWARFAAAAEAASDAADAIFFFTRRDAERLEVDRPEGQRLHHLPPFLPVYELPPVPVRPENGPMLSVGMMRSGDKVASYRIIADVLAQLGEIPWSLEIAGDGPERGTVETLMTPFGDRVQFLGRLDREGLAAAYGRASLLLWPGVNEAFGMAYLEAQATGLPVVAQDRPGMRDVLAPGDYPAPERGAGALASIASKLLADPELRIRRGTEARAMIAGTHLMGTAENRFWEAVSPLMRNTT